MSDTSAPPIEQNPDIRFLGRLLGNVIRAFGGEALFRRTEYIRSTSVDRHRGLASADAIDPGLDALTLDETLAFVRGFMLFSMLDNLAEDRPGITAAAGSSLTETPPVLEAEQLSPPDAPPTLDSLLIVPGPTP